MKEEKTSESISRRSLFQKMSFLGLVGGLAAVASSCVGPRRGVRRTSRRTSRRVSRRN